MPRDNPLSLIAPSEPHWVYTLIKPYSLLLLTLATPLAYHQLHLFDGQMIYGPCCYIPISSYLMHHMVRDIVVSSQMSIVLIFLFIIYI